MKLPYTPIPNPTAMNVAAIWYVPVPNALGHKPTVGPRLSIAAKPKGSAKTLYIGKSESLVR